MGGREALMTLAHRHDALEVFGTRFENVVEVQVVPEGSGMHTYYFARGIGLVGTASETPRSQVRLVSATVGGQQVRP